jgi:hypothetical protein
MVQTRDKIDEHVKGLIKNKYGINLDDNGKIDEYKFEFQRFSHALTQRFSHGKHI